MRTEARLILDCRNELGEMPVWCARSATLFWIDVTHPGRLFHWRTRDDAVDFEQFEDLITGVVRHTNGNLLVAGTSKIFEFAPATLRSKTLFSLPADQDGHRFNDGGCDGAGRLWIGSMQNNLAPDIRAGEELAPTGRIYCVSEAAPARSFEAALICPNALCWTSDNQTFYVADSGTGWIYSFDFDLDHGTIDRRREFCRLEGLGIPDGAAVDAQGYIWNARWGAGAVARISPTGQLDRIVTVAASNPTACCFGGSNLETLYVTTARYGLSRSQLAGQPFAGGVFAIDTGVPGLDKPAFGS
jgi:sugar lactone lactonase YvrE